jgi:hypothetical protein
MAGNLKKISSFLLLIVFLLPSVVKLEHHHDGFKCRSIIEKHIHASHKGCIICQFEFSVFLTDPENIELTKEKPSDSYCNTYNSGYNNNLSQFSFSLRAPPYKQF